MNKNFSIALIGLNLVLIGILVYVLALKTRNEQVYVDSGKLLNQYKGMIEAQKEIEQKTKVLQSNLDTLALDLENEIKKYEKERAGMSAKEAKLSEELLRNKQQQFMQYQEAIRGKMMEEEEKVKQRVLDKVNAFIKEYGEKKSIRFILGANSSGNIVYADKGYDVTDEILKELNTQYITK